MFRRFDQSIGVIDGPKPIGLASCLGTGAGGLLPLLAAALGLSLVIAQSAFAFSLIKYADAASRPRRQM